MGAPLSAHPVESVKNVRGKSFLLTSIYLFCLVNRRKCKACAPTGMGTEKETPFP